MPNPHWSAATPEQLMDEYAARTNTHQFESVGDLIAENAVYWFREGSYRGREAIGQAFERTWAVIREEVYSVEEVEWLAVDTQTAVCIYTFRWQGMANGQSARGSGRGTSVLRNIDDGWQMVHEHLSPMPADNG